MSTSHDADLDAALQRLTAEQVGNAPATPPFGDVQVRADPTLVRATDSSDGSGRWMLAAAAGVIALVAGLAIVTRNGAEPGSVASVENTALTTEEAEARAAAEAEAAEAAARAADVARSGGVIPIDAVTSGAGRPLAEIDELRRDEWVLPTVMLAGYDYQYASPDGMFQSVAFGPGFDQQEQIMINIFGDSFGGGDPTEEVTIGGATWEVQRSTGYWNGTRRVGSVFVSLGGPALDDATATAIIESLRVATVDEMTVPPLASPIDQSTAVIFERDGVIEPSDLSGEFDVKFYVIVAEVDLQGTSPDQINSPFVEARAFGRVRRRVRRGGCHR